MRELPMLLSGAIASVSTAGRKRHREMVFAGVIHFCRREFRCWFPKASQNPSSLAYKDHEAGARVLDQLTAEAQELGMGY
jgi:hypothetical protein